MFMVQKATVHVVKLSLMVTLTRFVYVTVPTTAPPAIRACIMSVAGAGVEGVSRDVAAPEPEQPFGGLRELASSVPVLPG